MLKWLLNLLLKSVNVEALVSNASKSILRELLMYIATRLKDEEIEKVEMEVRKALLEKLNALPKGLRSIVYESIEPALYVTFEALKHVDDASRYLAKLLERM